jgi:hypothetical protein
VLKEGRLKNIITHIKKHGAPPSKEAEAEAAAALSKLALVAAAAAARSYKLLPVEKDSQLDVHVHPEVKGELGNNKSGTEGHNISGTVGRSRSGTASWTCMCTLK